MLKLVLLSGCLLALYPATTQANVRACYYGVWASGRPYPAGIDVLSLDPNLCTHIIVSFLKVNDQHKLDYYGATQSNVLNNAVTLKIKNPSLKVMVAVGGWTHGSKPFLSMAKAVNGPKIFADSAVKLLKKHRLDGLDIDWEYPTGNKGALSTVLKALRGAFDNNKDNKLLLTAAVSGNKHTAPKMYDYDVLGNTLDYVFIMSYDLHGKWDSTTGHQSALQGDSDNFDVSSAAKHFKQMKVPQDKIILGFPTYGRTFMLKSDNHAVGAPTIVGKAVAGRYTKESGILAYYEICAFYLAKGATYKWDSKSKASYLYKGSTWVSFDSKQAYCHKLSWLHKNGFGGWMVWAMDLDDHANMCSDGKNPMMTYLKNNVGKTLNESDCDSPDLLPTYPNTTFTTAKPGVTDDNYCDNKKNGNYIDYRDCSKFIVCANTNKFSKTCPAGLVYNGELQLCDWPANVDCNRTTDASTSTTETTVTHMPMGNTTTVFALKFCSGKTDGYYANVADDCRSFYQCVSRRTYTFHCPDTLKFDQSNSVCNWANIVTCLSQETKPPTTEVSTEIPEAVDCMLNTGFFPEPGNARNYIWCAEGRKYHMSCAPGTVFLSNTKTCG